MRRLPALILIALLIALVVWIARNTYWKEVSVALPPRGAAAENPLYAAQHLVRLLGGEVHSSHQLPAALQPDAIIVLSSWNWNLIPERRVRLEKWVQSGGRLVIDPTVFGGQDLDTWTQTRRDALGRLRPLRSYVWARTSGDQFQVIRISVGAGYVAVFAKPSYLNHTLLLEDNAQDFVTAMHLQPKDQVYFLNEAAGEPLLVLIWRHGFPAVLFLLAAIVLAMWRSSAAFGPRTAAIEPGRRSLAEQIRGTGRFILRFGAGRSLHAAQVRALGEAANRYIPHYERYRDSAERLNAIASLTGQAPGELLQALDYNASRGSQQLRSAITVLEVAQRTISARGLNRRKNQEGSRHAG